MKYEWMEEYLCAKAGVEHDFKLEWGWERYMIRGKMFAARCFNAEGRDIYITLKLDPAEGDFLRRQYEDIIPGYYMNKEHWNSIKTDGSIPDDLVKSMLDKSYALILASFSRKKQQEILSCDAAAEELSPQ